MDITIWKVNRQ